MEKRTKESKKRINSLILLIAFTAIMLIVSTYAWFTSQKDITLSNLRGTVEVAENMEISLDAANWSQEIDLRDAEATFAAAQSSRDGAYTGTSKAILPKELLPVSATGAFESTSTILPMFTGSASASKLTDISACDDVTDKGYFSFDIYIKDATKDKTPGKMNDLQLNLNSSMQVLPADVNDELAIVNKLTTDVFGNEVLRTYLGDADSGLQNTVRLALALIGDNVASTASQADVLTATTGKAISDVTIWEPNASDHVEYVVKNNNKLTKGGSGVSFTDGTAVDTYAVEKSVLTSEGGEGSIANVWKQDSSGLAYQPTTRTEKYSADDYRIKASNHSESLAADDALPVSLKSVLKADGSAIATAPTDARKNFQIEANTISRLRVYVWLEGQDVDCINQASNGGGIIVDLGLTKDNEVGEVKTAYNDTIVSST